MANSTTPVGKRRERELDEALPLADEVLADQGRARGANGEPAPVKCAICKSPLDESQRKPLLQFFICADGLCQPEPILSRMDDPNDVDVSEEP